MVKEVVRLTVQPSEIKNLLWQKFFLAEDEENKSNKITVSESEESMTIVVAKLSHLGALKIEVTLEKVPVKFSLQCLAALKVARLLGKVEQVQHLELPRCLKEEVAKFMDLL